ncbi:hypothetical protein PoB_007423100 [Plakobranchus ocellatus]|uniref:Uncharacterized protein n=1 Tax=Plakobranchus ocellatus TaxID=259542 RepID=A0AAV4DUY4_9GAST|nr:hypothetical protein PoB_007423100 [Plakobranchus ocellatus]
MDSQAMGPPNLSEGLYVHNKVIRLSSPPLVVGLEPSTAGFLQISGSARYLLCHQRPFCQEKGEMYNCAMLPNQP